MATRNGVFFEEYAKLDKLLIRVYHGEKGVTFYLDTMKEHETERHGGHWEYTYKKLRYLRHKRNNMAHEPGAFETEQIDTEDMAFLRDFYKEVERCKDPLAPLFGREPTASERSENIGCITAAIAAIVVVVLIAICIAVFGIEMHP